ncbi:hypothetical protein AVEN_59400-1 [Araneus ventricosus]|uniref:Uncharacterized protein n=1 Tax=Araneus ventricosus TaxID=182803 RepID=A0A4Y2GLR4_ARAVE|nr:hypothetical protein AVEN_59400-1 [Araneus ventricosus]
MFSRRRRPCRESGEYAEVCPLKAVCWFENMREGGHGRKWQVAAAASGVMAGVRHGQPFDVAKAECVRPRRHHNEQRHQLKRRVTRHGARRLVPKCARSGGPARQYEIAGTWQRQQHTIRHESRPYACRLYSRKARVCRAKAEKPDKVAATASNKHAASQQQRRRAAQPK